MTGSPAEDPVAVTAPEVAGAFEAIRSAEWL
jgi:hypothetical protein